MRPDRSDVHIDQALTQISVASMNKDDAFISQKVFQGINVKKLSDKYFIFTKSDTFRLQTKLRAPSAKIKHRDYGLSTSTYIANEYANGILVPDIVVENSDLPLQPYTNATDICVLDMKMFMEKIWSDEFLVTGAWTSELTLSGTTQWNDYANSDPIANIDTACRTVNGFTGIPTYMLSIAMGALVYDKLIRHPDVIALFGGGNPAFKVASPQDLAKVLKVKEVLVGEAVVNLNNEGNSTQTLSRIVGKNALVFYRPTSPGLMEPAAGYFFNKTQAEVRRYDIPERRSQAVEVTSIFDFKSVDADAGYLFINAVA